MKLVKIGALAGVFVAEAFFIRYALHDTWINAVVLPIVTAGGITVAALLSRRGNKTGRMSP